MFRVVTGTLTYCWALCRNASCAGRGDCHDLRIACRSLVPMVPFSRAESACTHPPWMAETTDPADCRSELVWQIWVRAILHGQTGCLDGFGWVGGEYQHPVHLHGLLSAAGGAYWPLATSPCPSLEPFPSAGGGAHRPATTSCP